MYKRQTDPVTATVAGGGNVTFDNGPYYYPMSSKVNYSFYSCYPVARTAVAARRSISCPYTIDGKTDIMWGSACLLYTSFCYYSFIFKKVSFFLFVIQTSSFSFAFC